jgi:hypothetical protein
MIFAATRQSKRLAWQAAANAASLSMTLDMGK